MITFETNVLVAFKMFRKEKDKFIMLKGNIGSALFSLGYKIETIPETV